MDISSSLSLATLVAMVTALVELAKKLGLPSPYAPILSILISLGLIAVADRSVGVDLIIPAIIVGLAASGLYSGAKTTIKAVSTK